MVEPVLSSGAPHPFVSVPNNFIANKEVQNAPLVFGNIMKSPHRETPATAGSPTAERMGAKLAQRRRESGNKTSKS